MIHRASPKPALPVALAIVETILVFARLRVFEKGELACVRIEEGECLFYFYDLPSALAESHLSHGLR